MVAFLSFLLLLTTLALLCFAHAVPVSNPPHPTSTTPCETISHVYRTENASKTYYAVQVITGTANALGRCSSPLAQIGKLAAGPSKYVLPIPPNNVFYFNGRIESCNALSVMTGSAGDTNGTAMSCSQTQVGTFTNTQTITTSYEVSGDPTTRTSSISLTIETITAMASATWKAAPVTQTNVWVSTNTGYTGHESTPYPGSSLFSRSAESTIPEGGRVALIVCVTIIPILIVCCLTVLARRKAQRQHDEMHNMTDRTLPTPAAPPEQPQLPSLDPEVLQARIAQLEAELSALGGGQNQGESGSASPPAYRRYEENLSRS